MKKKTNPIRLNQLDGEEYFEEGHLQKDLKAKSIRSGAITLISQGSTFGLRMISTIVLARLLTPGDFGLIAMVTAITGFVEMFKDLGLSMATVQRSDINHPQVTNLFWINVAVSILVGAALALGSPLIAWFYKEQRLIRITLALASTLILSGLTVQHMALLNRQLRFFEIACIQVGSMAISVSAGIGMALYGMGYWSLVGMSIALQLTYVVLSWSVCKWRPSMPIRKAGTGALLKFGGHLTGFNIVNYFARNFDNILIGRFCGATALGFYSKAYSLMMLPITQIRTPLHKVSIPVLSRLQDDPPRFRRYYIKLVGLIAFITMPLMVFSFINGDKIIILVLGDRWLGAISIFKMLCIAAFVQPVSTTWGLVLVSLGQSGRYLKWGILNSLIIIGSFAAGINWGGFGVATGYAIATYTLLLPTLWYCLKLTPIRVTDFFRSIWKQVTASLISGCSIFLTRSCIDFEAAPLFILLASLFAVYLIGFTVVFLILPGGLADLREYLSYRLFLKRKAAI